MTSTATDLTVGSETLLTQAHNLLVETLSPRLKHFHELLPTEEPASRQAAAGGLPVLEWLEQLPEPTAITHRLVAVFTDAAPHLQWGQTYTAEDVSDDFLARYGWSEIVGTRGPIAAEDVALGFLLLGPEVEYPRHAHEAEEVYIPLAGIALWQRGQDDFKSQPPGAVIHHSPGMPHAIRTSAEPLLALYVWCGADLTEKSSLL